MTVTDKYILFYMPKTGSQFILNKIRKYIKFKNKSVFFRILNFNKKYNIVEYKFKSPYEIGVNDLNQHGSVLDAINHNLIGQRKIVCTIRNPYEWYMSQHAYAYHERKYNKEHHQFNLIKSEFNTFPILNSIDFIRFINRFPLSEAFETLGLEPRSDIGIYSVMFIIMYSKTPKETLLNITKDNVKDFFSEILQHYHFIRNEHISEDFMSLLTKTQTNILDKYLVHRIFKEDRMNVSPKSQMHEMDVNGFLCIQEKEWLILNLFPEYSEFSLNS
jgi:hypothetical protein